MFWCDAALRDIGYINASYVGNFILLTAQILIANKKLQFPIGQLEYVGSLSAGQVEMLGVPFIIGIAAAAAGFLITVIVIICVAYTMKSRESVRVMRRMRNQMDVLEARVAKECKEGK
jgi:hypothetical protein